MLTYKKFNIFVPRLLNQSRLNRYEKGSRPCRDSKSKEWLLVLLYLIWRAIRPPISISTTTAMTKKMLLLMEEMDNLSKCPVFATKKYINIQQVIEKKQIEWISQQKIIQLLFTLTTLMQFAINCIMKMSTLFAILLVYLTKVCLYSEVDQSHSKCNLFWC